MPQGRQYKPDDDDPLRESWRGEKLSNGKEVRDAGDAQGNDEGQFTRAAELARANCQRHKQNSAEPVHPTGWSEPHGSVVLVRNCATVCAHSLSHTAVRGALSGASRSSAASCIKSAATSMS